MMRLPGRYLPILLLCLLLLAACNAPATTPTPSPTSTPPQASDPLATANPPLYRDAAQPIELRVEDLLARMTLAEKIGQMTLVEKNSIQQEDLAAMGIGALLSGGGGGPRDNTPAGWLAMVRDFQDEALTSRLAIPLLYGVDAVHGHSNVEGTVIFPHNIGLGATGNPDLLREIGRVTALETIATGIYWNYAPVLAVPQDIRWGRTYEAYSENTELVSTLGNAYLLGLQGVDGTTDLAHPLTLLATPKHWVGDGGTEWGSSTTDSYQIDQGVTAVDEATLRAVHIPPYIAAIDNGAMSVMISYSSWGGKKMHAQEQLITDVLKEELGFSGFVVSDWQAIDQIDPNYYQAVVTAINAGIDMNMVPTNYRHFIDSLQTAVERGDVPMERIDDAVRRILTVKFALGLFETPYPDASLLDQVGSTEHREVARQAVRQSLVLLQNAGGVLPLSDAPGTVFVAGELADDIGLQSGGWTIEWQGKAGAITPGTTLLQGIEAAVTPDTDIYFNRFGKFDSLTTTDGTPMRADVGIVVLGERPYAEGRGDQDDLTVNPTILERVREQSDVVVVILISGRPLIITDLLPLGDAFVAAWLPGSEGQGVADVLFGDYPFNGRLPFTWPRTMEQLPFDFSTLPESGCQAPLFPYGYGLTIIDIDRVSPPVCDS